MPATELTAELAREWIAYAPETGLLTWRKSPRYGIQAGDTVGCLNKRGYVVLALLGGKYMGHRLAWLIHFGRWPEHCIDHINRCESDNRIANLRDVPQAVNLLNRAAPVAPRSGYKKPQVVMARSGRFRGRATVNGVRRYVGTFDTFAEAYEAAAAVL